MKVLAFVQVGSERREKEINVPEDVLEGLTPTGQQMMIDSFVDGWAQTEVKQGWEEAA